MKDIETLADTPPIESADKDTPVGPKMNEMIDGINNNSTNIKELNKIPTFYKGSYRFETGVLTTSAQNLAGVSYYRDTRTIQFGKTFKEPPLISIQEETAVPHYVRAIARNITRTSAEIVTTRADTVSTGIVVSFIGEI